MEEKERYIIGKGEDIFIADNDRKVMFTITTKKLQDLLNQQAKRIKELEEENGYVLFEDGYDKDGNEIHKQVYTTYKEEFTKLVLENKKLRKENQQLKQQLHDLPKKIVGEINKKLHDRLNKIDGYGRMTTDEFSFFVENEFTKDIDTILKKYGGEEWLNQN